MSIYVAWIGERQAPMPLIREVTADVSREFGLRTTCWWPPGRPEGTLNLQRQQHSSRLMLAWLLERLPGADAKVIGITDVDLFIPVLTFVFGEAQLGGHAAVVSTARLHDASPPVLRARLVKETVHELGHTFGLVHCASPACVMARSPTIIAIDVKSPHLCADCQVRFRERMKETAYVAAHNQNPDRR